MSADDVTTVSGLAAAMSLHGLTELEVSGGGLTVRLRRGPASHPAGGTTPVAVNGHAPPLTVRAPCAGVFFAGEPGSSAPLVEVGTRLTPSSIVGLIQDANQVVNEILAETTGRVVRVLVADGHAVETGQTLCEVSTS